MSVFAALRERFAAPEWAYFEEVRNGTGFSRRTTRTADGLAFSLWPSRGLELHGIEVKVSRSDWLREKRDPEKAEEIGRFCSRWWLATTPGVVKDVGEIPVAWGWLEVEAGKLRQRKDAPAREAQPLDLPMVAAILRKQSELTSAQISESVRSRMAVEMAEEREKHRADVERWREERALLDGERSQAWSALRNVERLLSLELFAGYPPRPQISDAAADKLRALGATDLSSARRACDRAANELALLAQRLRECVREGQ
jgi:hypothetical protein